MKIVKGQLYDETQDTETILDEQERMRRDPIDTVAEQRLFSSYSSLRMRNENLRKLRLQMTVRNRVMKDELKLK